METNNCEYEVEPFYFGEASKELFGCYHRPKCVLPRNCGIVLCSPIGQEYILSHRAFYQLALKLVNLGFPVLRFDYFGCGDSAGYFDQGSLRQWVGDIRTAAMALADRSNLSRIILLGLRMGASLSIMAAAQSDVFDTIVLWEPVLDGRCYLSEVTAMHNAFTRSLRSSKANVPGMPNEVLGFPLSVELKKDIESIQTDQWRLGPEMRLMAVNNNPDGTCTEELSRFLKANPQAEHHVIGDHRVWREALYKRLIPIKTINSIANWIDKANP